MNSENIRHVHILQYVNMKNNEMFYENKITSGPALFALDNNLQYQPPPGPAHIPQLTIEKIRVQSYSVQSLHGNPIRLVISEIFTTRLKVNNAYESSTVEQ